MNSKSRPEFTNRFVRKLQDLIIQLGMTTIMLCAYLHPQSLSEALPVLVNAQVPHYPAPDQIAGVQGTVRMHVETGGEVVQRVTVIADGGHLLLARAAQDNMRTWQFQKHDHASFVVTYRYLLRPVADGRTVNAVLRLPLYVEVIAQPWRSGEPHRREELGKPTK